MSANTETSKHPRQVVILLSTYNGAAFIKEQLDSILAQLPSDGQVLIRDDGSTDGTPAVIREVQANEPRISLMCGENIGFGKSFLTLLKIAPNDADLVMFSDQDDVWMPDKIERAWQALKIHQCTPALYSSRQRLVDANLKLLTDTPVWPRTPSFENALCENIVTGCTAALNNQGLKLFQNKPLPRQVYFHDWWLYLVVSAFGVILVDNQPTLLYRQHGKNTMGHDAGWVQRRLQVARFIIKNDWTGILLRQVNEFHSLYHSDLPLSHKKTLARNFSFDKNKARVRLSLIIDFKLRRQHPRQELIFRGLMAFSILGISKPKRASK